MLIGARSRRIGRISPSDRGDTDEPPAVRAGRRRARCRGAAGVPRRPGARTTPTTPGRETFLAALRAYPDLRPDSNVRAWLVTIAHRKAIDVTRATARRPVPGDRLPEIAVDGPAQRRRRRRRPAGGAGRTSRPSSARPSPTTTSPGSRYAEVGGRSSAATRPRPPQGRRRRHRPPPRRLPEGQDRMIATDPLLDALLAPHADADLDRLRDRLATEADRRRPARRRLPHRRQPVRPAAGRGHAGRARPGRLRAEGHDAVLERLAAAVSPRVLAAPAAARRGRPPARRVLRRAAPELRRRRSTSVWPTASAAAVLDHLREHRLRRHRDLHRRRRRGGEPRGGAGRGHGLRHNPIPIVVPCHRVVRSDGTIGQYLGGTETKAALLALEAA